VAYSPDGRILAGGCQDRTVRLWDAETGVEVHCLSGHTQPVACVAFSADGSRLASGSMDLLGGTPGEVKVWDARTGVEVLSLMGHTGPVLSVAFSLDRSRLASASQDGTVKVWDATVRPGASVP
jgi:WD40 repeat protein